MRRGLAFVACRCWPLGLGGERSPPAKRWPRRSGSIYRARALRPRFHFTPARNFMNDPNGLVFLDGEYHLFYQHNPFGDRWGHMSWGHAVSPDLLRWEHLPVALRGRARDHGLLGQRGRGRGQHQRPLRRPRPTCLVAIYTGHGHDRQTQNLAASRDRGRTWTKYAGNPVLDLGLADFRDPKVFWHAPTRRWIMVAVLADQKKVRFFGSRRPQALGGPQRLRSGGSQRGRVGVPRPVSAARGRRRPTTCASCSTSTSTPVAAPGGIRRPVLRRHLRRPALRATTTPRARRSGWTTARTSTRACRSPTSRRRTAGASAWDG